MSQISQMEMLCVTNQNINAQAYGIDHVHCLASAGQANLWLRDDKGLVTERNKCTATGQTKDDAIHRTESVQF